MKDCVTGYHSVSRFNVNQNLRSTKDHEAESVSAYALEQGARSQVKKCERQKLLLTPNGLAHWRQYLAHFVRDQNHNIARSVTNASRAASAAI